MSPRLDRDPMDSPEPAGEFDAVSPVDPRLAGALLGFSLGLGFGPSLGSDFAPCDSLASRRMALSTIAYSRASTTVCLLASPRSGSGWCRLIPSGGVGLCRLLGRLVALLATRGSGATRGVWRAIRVAPASRGQEHLKVLGTEMTGRIISSHIDDLAMYTVNAAS